jgi:hypothetical protein
MKKIPLIAAAVLGLILAAMAVSQQRHHSDDAQISNQENSPPASASGQEQMDVAAPAMHSHHMESGPHMTMTDMRTLHPGDRERAQEIVDVARKTMERYKDYHVALKDGYKIFLPNIPQPQYHFTNNWYGLEAAFRFNPEHLTSLLYEKTKDGGYNLIGAMYTAPENSSPDDLDQRIPLSVAQWHLHTNLCLPPKERRAEMLQPNPKFGLAGSIATQDECEQAGGRFLPHIFGWMIHVYPYEKDPGAIWAMSAKHDAMDHAHMH